MPAILRENKCRLCQRQFNNRNALTNHSLEHKGTDGKFHCNVCSRKYKHFYRLQMHFRDSHTVAQVPEEERIYAPQQLPPTILNVDERNLLKNNYQARAFQLFARKGL